jgi:chemosensory pili system protein ChpC
MTEATSSEIEIRGVLLPLQGAQLLLPNAAVLEVDGFQEPEPLAGDKPDWLLGMFNWRQQKVPLVSFEQLVGVPVSERGVRARIAVCNTLGGNLDCPYLAIVLESLPHLVRVSEGVIFPLEEQRKLGGVVASQVLINREEAWIPDLNALEWMVQETLT